jgi:hypothetical protein
VWPAFTVTVLLALKSRTRTVPRVTFVSVPSQRSWTSQIVPRTVAELYLPLVRKRPLPLPHSLPSTALGPFFLSTVAERAPFGGAHCERAIWPFITRSVVSAAGFLGFFFGTACLTWKMPW